MKFSDELVLGWIALASFATFLLFAFDKWRARKSVQRISEWQLVLWSATGGWPGGLLAMILFRHKTMKGSFQFKFCFAFLVFAAGLALYLYCRKSVV